ncbi:amidase [Acrocarpospora catenulata]|uniref:amidase n=1 Tax=Acrocarpospora catenulata TaxID=2836182 RepID=UPI001BDAD802|nr:amidase family protein [Acrocarpospora catenulata]
MTNPFHTWTAIETAKQIRERVVSPVEVMASLLDRAALLDPAYASLQVLDPELAMDAARRAEAQLASGAPTGPLHGVPVSVKDLLATADLPTRRGSRLVPGGTRLPDAPSVRLLKQSGALVFAKTTTSELGHKATTESLVSAPTCNPWDRSRTAGGSSGGAGAAVALGLGPLAVATDGGGSIRIPASFCGVLGVKPTTGTVPTFPPSRLGALGHIGVLSRDVRDAALALSVLAGRHAADPEVEWEPEPFTKAERRRVRVGFYRTVDGTSLDPDVERVLGEFVHGIESIGLPVSQAPVDLPDAGPVWDVLFMAAMADEFATLDDRAAEVSSSLLDTVKAWRRAPPGAGEEAEARRAVLRHTVAGLFSPFDVLIGPTLPVTAFPLGQQAPVRADGLRDDVTSWWRNTQLWNLTGMPTVSLPGGFDRKGLPVGIQITGRSGQDHLVLRMCRTLEAEGRTALAAFPQVALL